MFCYSSHILLLLDAQVNKWKKNQSMKWYYTLPAQFHFLTIFPFNYFNFIFLVFRFFGLSLKHFCVFFSVFMDTHTKDKTVRSNSWCFSWSKHIGILSEIFIFVLHIFCVYALNRTEYIRSLQYFSTNSYHMLYLWLWIWFSFQPFTIINQCKRNVIIAIL